MSAQTAVGVEIPRLILFHPDLANTGAANWSVTLQSPPFDVSVKNYGRTPAFVISQSVEILWGATLPAQPDYNEHAYNVEPETVVEPGGVHDFETVRPRTLLSADEVEAIRWERLFLWVYGYIAYRDLLGQRHQHRCCKQLVPIPLGSRSYSFIECDSNPRYTESY